MLGYEFRDFDAALALSIALSRPDATTAQPVLSKEEMDMFLTPYDLKRIESYSRNLVDYHIIMDLLPTLGRMVFLQKFPFELTMLQASIMIGMGLQYKSVTQLETELNIQSRQVLSLFNKAIRKISGFLSSVQDAAISASLPKAKPVELLPLQQSLIDDLDDGAAKIKEPSSDKGDFLASLALPEYAIRGTDTDWASELSRKKGLSVVSIKKRKTPETGAKTPTAKWSKSDNGASDDDNSGKKKRKKDGSKSKASKASKASRR